MYDFILQRFIRNVFVQLTRTLNFQEEKLGNYVKASFMSVVTKIFYWEKNTYNVNDQNVVFFKFRTTLDAMMDVQNK